MAASVEDGGMQRACVDLWRSYCPGAAEWGVCLVLLYTALIMLTLYFCTAVAVVYRYGREYKDNTNIIINTNILPSLYLCRTWYHIQVLVPGGTYIIVPSKRYCCSWYSCRYELSTFLLPARVWYCLYGSSRYASAAVLLCFELVLMYYVESNDRWRCYSRTRRNIESTRFSVTGTMWM